MTKRNALVGLVIFLVLLLASFWLGLHPWGPSRQAVERDYKAQGFQMVEGCNGGAANQARFDVYKFDELLQMATNSPRKNSNLFSELKRGNVLAQEEFKVLSADCGKRGHRDTYPWKTNWAEIKQILRTSEEQLYK